MVFTFETTHHALWAEEVAREEAIAHEVIAAPSESRAKCSIAIEVLAEDQDLFAAALGRAGVPFDIFDPPKTLRGEE